MLHIVPVWKMGYTLISPRHVSLICILVVVLIKQNEPITVPWTATVFFAISTSSLVFSIWFAVKSRGQQELSWPIKCTDLTDDYNCCIKVVILNHVLMMKAVCGPWIACWFSHWQFPKKETLVSNKSQIF